MPVSYYICASSACMHVHIILLLAHIRLLGHNFSLTYYSLNSGKHLVIKDLHLFSKELISKQPTQLAVHVLLNLMLLIAFVKSFMMVRKSLKIHELLPHCYTHRHCT